MTLKEAIESGKDYKRSGSDCDWYSRQYKNYEFNREEVLADDWQIKEEKYTLTKKQIIDAFMMSIADYNSTYPHATYHSVLLPSMLEKLGIK